jgi:hypothetical protein
MEEKILVHKYESEIRSGKGFYEAVRINIQELVDFLVENEVEPTLNMVVGLIRSNRSSKALFEERERQILKDVPKILRSSVNTGTAENIKACDEIIQRANRLLTYSDNSRLIDFSKWSIENNKVIITEAVFKELEESSSIYIDTPSKKAIYEKAIAAKKALEDLNQAVINVSQRGLGDGLKVIGIAPANRLLTFSILEVHGNGDVELIGERFDNIL